jgi:16S rRNA (cytidine1402-2'-O)-methyltransferase
MSMSATATYSKVLDLAQELVGHQTLSTHTLYMIASPIGNLADISIRALFVLQKVDFIACEDTRHTQSLCRSYGLEIASNQWISVHQHNELEGAQKVTQALQSGARVAYLSDAGTPGVSDPGSRLVSACVDQGLRVVPIPGPSSVTTLLSASGAHQGDDQSFIFLGFLSSKATVRAEQIQAISLQARAQVILEAPHRIMDLAKALAPLDERLISVGRELTKQFESIQRLKARELLHWLEEDPHRQKGEFSILIHPLQQAHPHAVEDFKVLGLLLEHLPLKTAVALSTTITGQAKKVLYTEALRLKALPMDEADSDEEL